MRTSLKLHPPELLIDERLERSRWIIDRKQFILLIVNEHIGLLSLPSTAPCPSMMDCNEGRSINYLIDKNAVLLIVMREACRNAQFPNSIFLRQGRSIK